MKIVKGDFFADMQPREFWSDKVTDLRRFIFFFLARVITCKYSYSNIITISYNQSFFLSLAVVTVMDTKTQISRTVHFLKRGDSFGVRPINSLQNFSVL